jgi:hypothetical protein
VLVIQVNPAWLRASAQIATNSLDDAAMLGLFKRQVLITAAPDAESGDQGLGRGGQCKSSKLLNYKIEAELHASQARNSLKNNR